MTTMNPSKDNKRGYSLADRLFKWLAVGSASLVILLMAGFFLQLLLYSVPALRAYGPGFFWSNDWGNSGAALVDIVADCPAAVPSKPRLLFDSNLWEEPQEITVQLRHGLRLDNGGIKLKLAVADRLPPGEGMDDLRIDNAFDARANREILVGPGGAKVGAAAPGLVVETSQFTAPTATADGSLSFSVRLDHAPKKLYGAASSVYGTLATTLIAMLIAVPLSFITALFLVELATPWVGNVMSQALDLLAAVPSIIFGMWGLFVFVPFMQAHFQPILAKTLGFLPFFRSPESSAGGQCVFTAGVVLALMILPFVCAITRDVFKMVPSVVKESAYGMGATTWEVTFDVTMRYGMQGLLGAVFLGLGRAIGETMAVLFIIGNSPSIAASLFAPGNTIASALANYFQEADGLFKSALFLLGLALLTITFAIQIVAQMWLNQVRRKAGGGL